MSDSSLERIQDIDINEEMEHSFLEYAYSVIHARALPDAKDGLKPVQRRILFQMKQMGLTPDKGHVKSQRVVGDVMGKLHPHGDSAIYDALVRLAQPFTMRVPLIDGHGNFGSLDDGPAAARYTEARLAPAALALVDDLDEDVVDFVPNYDNQLTQPAVLPAAFPNLLVNGANGIAVGMATNIPPHNVGETINAAIYLLDHPQADTAELMKYCPGPDLPGGGIIVGLDGIREAYETGRGIFITRARATIEQVTARKRGIVITELPYQVGPERVAEKLKESVSSGKVKGVSGWQDLSDRTHGMRLVVEVKNGFHPEAVLASLYKYTPLQESFGINTVALVDGQPRTLGLKAALQVFVDHRVEVTRRRSEFRLKKKQERLHLVDGLLIAVLNLDEVIEVIRTSDDSAAARQRLMTVFDLSEAQAEFILELRLRRLTKFSRLELEAEADELRQAIAELEQILASTEKLHDVVRSDMRQTAARLSTPRRTVLLEEDGSAVAASKDAALPVLGTMTVSDVPLEVPDAPCRIVLGADGRAIRLANTGPVNRLEGFNSTIAGSILTHTRGCFGVVTSSGFVVRLDVLSLPPGEKSSLADSAAGASSAAAAGSTETADIELNLSESAPPWSFDGAPQLSAAARFEDGETVVGILTLDEDETVGMMTAHGIVKRMRPDYPSTQDRFSIINLDGTDQLIYAGACPDDAQIVMISTDAQLLRTPANKVRPQGRNAGGVAGMSLKEHTQVIAGAIVPDDLVAATTVATVAAIMNAMPGANQSSIKLTPLDRYPVKGRGAQGVRVQRFLKGEYALDMAFVGPDPIHAIDAHGKPVKLPELDERRDGSGSNLKSNIAYFG
ncbi:DNA topoisomerase (ATP-hydrolyzing) subunit A [Mobiluncus curtisii]|uniref:DNA topoisomerase (ATP-hydrolyzing) n=1 Tax=Mobiluncus curtisii ATCC 51333 TaxID=887326 RepID=E6LZG9_9ACTO|nr:DNA topoisomerase IV subunit A [Mobiluncus curtisii]EFU80025.1 DNA gyrase/topoisomerase IV, A subunit [Mobiluncus curtisii ATCC 51333]